MICPRCGTKKQLGKYCSECGRQLKEMCPKCGKLESIDRKVCESDLIKTEETLAKHSNTIWRFLLFFAFGVFSITYLWMKTIEKAKISISVSLFLCFFSLLVIIGVLLMGSAWNISAQEKARFKFLKENPKHREILQKAGLLKKTDPIWGGSKQ